MDKPLISLFLSKAPPLPVSLICESLTSVAATHTFVEFVQTDVIWCPDIGTLRNVKGHESTDSHWILSIASPAKVNREWCVSGKKNIYQEGASSPPLRLLVFFVL